MISAATTGMLAQMSRWSRLGDGFRSGGQSVEPATLLGWAIVASMAALGVILYMQYRSRNDMSVRCDDPEKLFRELCLVHRLTAAPQRSLRQLAATRGLANPAQIFLTPSAFESRDLTSQLGFSEAQLEDLRSRLF